MAFVPGTEAKDLSSSEHAHKISHCETGLEDTGEGEALKEFEASPHSHTPFPSSCLVSSSDEESCQSQEESQSGPR